MNTLGGETMTVWQVGGLVSSCKCYLNRERSPFRLGVSVLGTPILNFYEGISYVVPQISG